MKDTKLKKTAFWTNGISRGLFIVSLVFFAVSIYMLRYNIAYIANYASSYGVSVTTIMGDALQYIMTGFIPYFAYAVITFAGAEIAGRLALNAKAVKAEENDNADPEQETEKETEEEQISEAPEEEVSPYAPPAEDETEDDEKIGDKKTDKE